MEFEPLELKHREMINSYLAMQRIESSELTFLTLYIWRKAFNIKLAKDSGCLIFEFRDNGFPPSLRFPLGKGDKKAALHNSCKYFIENEFEPRFYGLTKDMTEELLQLCPEKFRIFPTPDYFDYVYSVNRLIMLSGKELHSKKNHINRFKRTYDYQYMPLTSADYAEITTAYDEWLAKREIEEDYYLESEKQSISDILKNFDLLGCKGAKLYANGRLCAFTIGEQLNDNTALIHIEKADMEIGGAYAAINQMFLENEWSHLEYVNREDDFGIEGLRKAKQSYRPLFMVEKYTAILKEGAL